MIDEVNNVGMNLAEVDDENKDSGVMVSPNFGLLIKHYRTKVKGLSLHDLEKISGLSSSFISRLENQCRNVSIKNLKKLVDALNIPNDILIATMFIQSNDHEKKKETITDVLLKNDYIISEGRHLNSSAKEILLNLVETICIVEWSEKSKVRDLYQIAELVDQLKEAM